MVGEFTLSGFYRDHLIMRNTWSQSNCGMDLARYRGTAVTLYPTDDVDYLFWYDTDYGNFKEFETTVAHIHPAILINAQHTTVVLSRKTRGYYLPKRVFIPPPTVFANQWTQQSAYADKGLAIFALSCIDLKAPWIVPGMDFNGTIDGSYSDYTSSTGQTMTKVIGQGTNYTYWKLQDLWWNNVAGQTDNRPIVWAEQWPGWINEPPVLSSTQFPAVALGPFVMKNQNTMCQITLTYRSRWVWGGDILTTGAEVCDPKNALPKKALFGEQPADPTGFIDKTQLDPDTGHISDTTWRRLTSEPSTSSRPTTFLRIKTPEKKKPYEETSEEDISEFSSEEEENSSPEGSGFPRRRMDERRINELLRLRYVITSMCKNKAHTI